MRRSSKLHITSKESHADIAGKLRRVLPVGVCGTSSRTLEHVVTVAAQRGLEIRDPHGHLLLAAERLIIAYGYTPENARIRHRWTVVVDEPTMVVPDGHQCHIEQWGPNQSAVE